LATAGEADHTVFFQTRKHGSMDIASWYVDDGLLATNTTKSMDAMVNDITAKFEIQDLGKPTQLLGIKVDRNHSHNSIHISQPAFINIIAKQFNILSGCAVNSPMDATLDLRVSTDANDSINAPYTSLIGCLNYCTVFTRPDIANATNKCAQFIS
jgi:Reverse transcriptase (RNA-dependent DNA polymerase)